MKILVPVKRVADYNVKVRVKSDDNGVDIASVKMSMNPFDEITVGKAVRLKKKAIAHRRRVFQWPARGLLPRSPRKPNDKPKRSRRIFAGVLLAAVLAPLAGPSWAATPAKAIPLVAPSPIGGANGMGFGPDGKLYVGAVMSQGIFRVDLDTRAITQIERGPSGGADDMVFLPDGTLLWAAFMEGELMKRDPRGRVSVVASNLPGIDGIGFRRTDGRLFVSQCFSGDALWEVDPTGAKPPRKILSNLDCLNGFDFGSDGKLYGPSWFGGKIVRIDPDRPAVETVVDGLNTPAAVKFGPNGKLYAVLAGDGRLLEIDVATRAVRTVAQLGSGLDNLLPWGDDKVLVSSLAENSVVSVTAASGQVQPIVEGRMTSPGGMAVCRVDGRDQIFVADIATLKMVDPVTGAIVEIGRSYPSKGALTISPIVAATGSKTVILSDFSGTVQWIDIASGKVAGAVKGLSAPYAMAELPDGTIAVAEYGAGRIGRIDPRTSTLLAPLATGLSGPAGLLLLSDRRLLVSDAKSGTLAVVPIDGGPVRRIANGLKTPEGLALLPDGRVVLAEVGAKRLIVLDPSEKSRPQVLAENLPIGLPPQNSLPAPFVPTGVAVSGSSVYFGSNVDRGIYKLPLPSSVSMRAGSAPTCDVWK
ncbi:hypothetical protein E1956_17735 [Paraburkholderia pallida]|uniref:DNA-binding beta-propeller fold protein YncE n=1 Tax=Paraburkholderia pallida TaxID=2547399 RepID=A0A4P7CYE5_9BURK|nr:hypothetical protein E1956_17735 [Paraburkholderia pallida]